MIDAVANLRENLRAAGSDLIVRCGKPEEVYKQSPSSPQSAFAMIEDNLAEQSINACKTHMTISETLRCLQCRKLLSECNSVT